MQRLRRHVTHLVRLAGYCRARIRCSMLPLQVDDAGGGLEARLHTPLIRLAQPGAVVHRTTAGLSWSMCRWAGLAGQNTFVDAGKTAK
jgi:hypothetical protein